MGFLEHLSEITLGFVVELAKLLPIMIFVFGFKFQPTKRLIIFGLGAIVLLILSTALGIDQYLPINTYIGMLLTLFIVQGNNRIIYTLIAGFGISILDMFVATVWLAFNNQSYVQLADDTSKHIIVNSVNIATIFVTCVAAKLFFIKQKHIMPQNARRSYLILFMLGEISLFTFVTAFQLKDSSSDELEKMMAICLAVGSIVFLLTSIVLIMNHVSKTHFESISQINEKLIRSQEQYYTMLLQKEEETRKFRHDINNHLNCMRILFNEKKYDELDNYFEQMGVSVQNLHSELQIGNDLISAILKDVSDKHSSVSVNIVGKMPPTLRLDNMDICTIFYNLFDNAFTAAEDSNIKSVEISVKLLGENMFFTIKNTISHKIEIVNNILTTEKHNTRYHGFGSGNAVKCAERNGGELIYKCSDAYFEAELILPNIDLL
ncbi:MAG: GHKL domain-containing protein [Eubacterium sp.]|nr:GHKL domain-containing protein [Eubacterium sp.]